MKALGLTFILAATLTVAPAPADSAPAAGGRISWNFADALRADFWLPLLNEISTAPAAQEWSAAEAFIKKYSPRRWEAIESLGTGGEQQRSVRRFVIARYKSLMELKKKDSAMYKLQLRELELEDAVFGDGVRMRGETARERLHEALHGNVEKLVDVRLEIRKLRIERLEKSLAAAKAQLAKDQDNREALIEREMRAAMDHGRPSRHRWAGPSRHPRPATRPSTHPAATQPDDD